MAAKPDISRELQTSPIYRIRGQRSRWYYPNDRLTPEHCELLRNVNITERGTAMRRNGYTLYNTNQFAEGAKAVTGLFQGTWVTNGAQQVECGGTKVYADNGTTRKDITGAFTITDSAVNLYRFAFLKDTLIATNSVDSVWRWGGDYTTPTNIAAIAGSPQFTTCEDVVTHRNLLMILAPTESSTKYPTRIRWCDINRQSFVTSISTWPAANFYELYDGGPAIVGGCDNFGKLQIFKKDGLYPCYVEYNNGYIDFRAPERDALIRGFTPLARCSILARPEFVFVVCAEGAVAIRPDYSAEWITKDVQSDWNGLNQSRLQYAVSYVVEKDHQVRTLVSSVSNTAGHDLEMVWDWETGDVWFDAYADKINYAAGLRVSSAEYGFLGTTTGYVMQGNNSTTSSSSVPDNSQAFAWEIRMAPNDLGMPGKTKTVVDFISIYRSKLGQTAVELRVERDLNSLPARQISQTWGTGLTWNSGKKWNSGLKWPGGTTTQSKYFVNRTCENFRPRWRGTGPVELIGYQVTFQTEEE